MIVPHENLTIVLLNGGITREMQAIIFYPNLIFV